MHKLRIHNHIFSIAHRAHRKNSGYDIPLHTRLGTEFLVMLIALMTYLLLLAAMGSTSLGHMAHKWVAGLENAMTIEIPASDSAAQKAETLVKTLQNVAGVTSAKTLTQKDMGDILSPWLGNQTSVLAELPLPTLISVTLDKRTPSTTTAIKNAVNASVPEAIVDAHEDWLVDLLKLTNGLRFTAMVVFGMILFVTALVIAGAVRSRMAIHQRELELLHIMGASDRYISLQFIRYVLSQSLKGMGYGFLAGLLTFGAFVLFTRQSTGTVPEITLEPYDAIIFLSVPVLLISIGIGTARHTVLRVLNEMP